MDYVYVSTATQLSTLVMRMKDSDWIAFDTEFISEGRYQPQLCLVQVAFDDGLAIIDPITIRDLTPFWNLICDGRREVVVHANRNEMEFCYKAIHSLPEWLFDVQLAAGFIGIDYPVGFKPLVDKILGIDVSKGETRTDWQKRPLTNRQIEYGLNDVRYLAEISLKLKHRLKELGRFAWFHEESVQACFRLQRDMEQPKWRSTTKCSTLPPREQAIVRELWFWRDRLAKRNNQISSRVLRDDLIVEIAKLKTSDISRIETIRGMGRPDLVRQYDDISAAIERALKLEKSDLPEPSEKQSYPQYTVMVQFLFSAFNMICKKNRFSTPLVGTQTDVRELVAHLYGTLPDGIVPRLTRGWRAKVIGNTLADLLNGKISMRLNRNQPDEPIEFLIPDTEN